MSDANGEWRIQYAAFSSAGVIAFYREVSLIVTTFESTSSLNLRRISRGSELFGLETDTHVADGKTFMKSTMKRVLLAICRNSL